MPQLSLEVVDHIATVTLTNPPLAVMDSNTLDELSRLLPRLREDDVRAVVFTGGVEGYFIRHYSVVELDRSAQGSARRPSAGRSIFTSCFSKSKICRNPSSRR